MAHLPPLNNSRQFRSPGLPELDNEPTSPATPKLVDLANKRRSMLDAMLSAGSRTSKLWESEPPPFSAHSSPNVLESDPPIQKKTWNPIHLTTPYMIINIILLIIIAVVLEVLLRVNHHDYGWGTPSFYNRFPQIHVLWTFLPGVVAFAIMREWSEVDRYIKLLQPYIDMSSKRVSADRSVLLNYADKSLWTAWASMWQNKHVTPILTNLVVLLAIGVSPLFSSYLYLQQPSDNFTQPVGNITVLEQLGLQNPAPFEFTDAAAGFMKASSLYNGVGAPPFIRFLPGAAWTSTRVSVKGFNEDGTVKAHTVCLKSLVSCTSVSGAVYDTTTSTISGSANGCSFSMSTTGTLGISATIPFGMTPASCPALRAPATPDSSAVAFWVLGGANANTPIAAVCTPTIQVQRADVLLNTTNSALLLVNGQTPLLSSDYNQGGVDLNSAPYNGSAFNALFFTNATGAGAPVNLNSTQFGLGQAIATLYKQNDTSVSNGAIFASVASDAYAHYLGLVAQSLYFQPLEGVFTNGTYHSTNERLFVSAPVTHVLTVLLILIAICGTVIMVLHRRAARNLILTTEPGTLAAAVALAGMSDLSHLLKGHDTEEEMRAMLADLRFGIDPVTHRIVVEEGEGGYAEIPKSYMPRTARSPTMPLLPRTPGSATMPRSARTPTFNRNPPRSPNPVSAGYAPPPSMDRIDSTDKP